MAVAPLLGKQPWFNVLFLCKKLKTLGQKTRLLGCRCPLQWEVKEKGFGKLYGKAFVFCLEIVLCVLFCMSTLAVT